MASGLECGRPGAPARLWPLAASFLLVAQGRVSAVAGAFGWRAPFECNFSSSSARRSAHSNGLWHHRTGPTKTKATERAAASRTLKSTRRLGAPASHLRRLGESEHEPDTSGAQSNRSRRKSFDWAPGPRPAMRRRPGRSARANASSWRLARRRWSCLLAARPSAKVSSSEWRLVK